MALVTVEATLVVSATRTGEIFRRNALALRNVTPGPSADKDVAIRAYTAATRGQGSLSPAQVSALITSGFAPYATKTYVNSRDELNALKSQVDAGDATKLKISTRNAPNGIAGLDATGRVEIARVVGQSTQRWPKGPYVPTIYYGGGPTTAEGAFMIYSLPDPGYPYRLMVSGQFDGRISATGDSAVVRVRINSTAGPVIAQGYSQFVQYRYGVETFDRVAPTLGGGWEQTYVGTGTAHAETDGTKAFWVVNGNDATRAGFFRKITDYATTVDDYQEVFYRVATTIEAPGIIGQPPANRIYGRVNPTRTSYIAFDMTDTQARLVCANGGAEVTLTGPVAFAQNAGDEIFAQFGYYPDSTRRRLRLFRNGVLVIDHIDSGQVTALSTDNRGWGFGMRAGSSLLFGQARPAALDYIALTDPAAPWSSDPEGYTPVVLTTTAISQQPSLVGGVNLYVTVGSANGNAATVTNVLPRLHVMAIPA